VNDTIVSERQKQLFVEILRRLAALGYRGDLLTEGYEFPDWLLPNRPIRVAPAAAFARTPQAYDSACFAVLLPNGKSGAELVAEYRSLGAPFAFEITEDSVVYWTVGRDVARTRRVLTIRPDELERVFADNEQEWTCKSVLRVKNLAITLGPRQGELDLGLIPTLEAEIERKLDALLREVLLEATGSSPTTRPQDLFRLVFRFLAAKVLRDRGHPPFSALSDFLDADAVLRMVSRFYREELKPIADTRTRRAIAQALWNRVDFRNLSVEVLAYIYENTLVDKSTRKKYGTHSPPHNIARYIVHRLPFERITQGERLIVEPFSGHGIFLMASLQHLRDFLPNDTDEAERHSYFVKRLRGYEIDQFATEVSRLCLMLADFPNRNGWELHNEDVFQSKQFTRDLSRAGVVLCNPPFEDFDAEDRALYKPRSLHKPEELMHRVLDAIPNAAMLGFVLPQAFLDGANYREIRARLVNRFDEIETVGLPDRVFHISQQTAALLIAKMPRRENRPFVSITYTQVADKDRARFLAEYAFTRRDSQVKSCVAAEESLKVVALREIWDRLEHCPNLASVVTQLHRGVEWKQPFKDRYISIDQKPGFERGFHRVKGIRSFQPPATTFLCTEKENRRGKAWELPWQLPKVLANASRISRGQWCLAAFEERDGLLASQNFHALWPREPWTPKTLAAVLNGPIANAFVSCRESEQQRSRIETLEKLPMPNFTLKDFEVTDGLVEEYVRLVDHSRLPFPPDRDVSSGLLFWRGNDLQRARKVLLEIDATVLKAYGLPPRMEREVLEFFRGAKRKRPVPFEFLEYFPESFVPTIPLWMYISPDFENCSAESFLRNAPALDDPAIIDALKEVE
jgi:type I restriction-modification system DNA methylase subunit